MCVELGRGEGRSRVCVPMLHALVFCVQPGQPLMTCSDHPRAPPEPQCPPSALLGPGGGADLGSWVTIVAIYQFFYSSVTSKQWKLFSRLSPLFSPGLKVGSRGVLARCRLAGAGPAPPACTGPSNP